MMEMKIWPNPKLHLIYLPGGIYQGVFTGGFVRMPIAVGYIIVRRKSLHAEVGFKMWDNY